MTVSELLSQVSVQQNISSLSCLNMSSCSSEIIRMCSNESSYEYNNGNSNQCSF